MMTLLLLLLLQLHERPRQSLKQRLLMMERMIASSKQDEQY
jgi:hypothetical protein